MTVLRVSIEGMAMPEPSHDFHDRLTRVEDSMQEIRFVHMAKTDAQSNGMGILYAGQQRLEHMLIGFRAEVAAEFGALRSDVEAVKAEQARQGEKLTAIESAIAEILRRLPE